MLLIPTLIIIIESRQTLNNSAVKEINSMYKGKTVLVQMQSFIFGYDFKKTVDEHSGDKWSKEFTTKNLLSVMLYVHMASKQSLRDIVYSLESKASLN